jgi:hypothetical protein
MRNRVSIAMPVLALIGAFLAAPVAWAGVSADQFSPTLYWFCQYSTVPPAYLSNVVVTVASGKTNESIARERAATRGEIEKSFADFLAKKYGYTGLSSCLSNESRYWMESNRKARVASLQAHSQQIIETDWTYAKGSNALPPAAAGPAVGTTQRPSAVSATPPTTPVAAAPVPVKPAAPSIAAKPTTGAAAAQTPYAFCFGEVKGLAQTVYFGVPFEATVKNLQVWTAAYKEFLRNKYKFASLTHCQTLKSLPEARQQEQKVKDRYVAHWKVVEIGWKYQ